MLRRTIYLVLASAGVAGCGGGGGNNQTPPQTPSPTVALAASTTAAPYGAKVTLSWSSGNASSCSASGSWLGVKATSGNEDIGPLTDDATFSLSCDGAGGSTRGEITVGVVPGTQGTFVEIGGPLEHAGWVPTVAEPLLDAPDPARFELVMSEPIADGELELIDDFGALLGSAALVPNAETDFEPADYFANVRIPPKPFRFRVKGRDLRNQSFSYLWPHVYRPSTVRVKFLPLERTGASPKVLPLQVTNRSTAQRFRVLISALDDDLHVQPNAFVVDLESGATRMFDLAIDALGSANGDVELLAHVEGELDSRARNRDQVVFDPREP